MYNYQIPKRYKQFLLTIMLKDHFKNPGLVFYTPLFLGWTVPVATIQTIVQQNHVSYHSIWSPDIINTSLSHVPPPSQQRA